MPAAGVRRRGGCELRHARAFCRLADRAVEGLGRGYLVRLHDPEIQHAGDPQGRRARLASDPDRRVRRLACRQRSQARGVRERRRREQLARDVGDDRQVSRASDHQVIASH